MQTKLIINNSYTTIEGYIPPSIYQFLGQEITLYKKLKYPYPHTERYNKTVSLWEKEQNRFPAGLTYKVRNFCQQYGSEVTIEDRRNKPVSHPYKLKKDIKYREQAQEGIDTIIKKGRGILSYPTAFGKTNTAIKIIAELGCKTLYIVPSKGLLQQAKNDISEYIDTSIGMIGDGYKDYVFEENNKYLPNILIITSSSLWSIFKTNYDLFDYITSEIECFIVDECHHVRYNAKKSENPWNSLFVALSRFKNAYYRIGMSATLYDDIGRLLLEGITGKVQHKVDRIEAEENGIVCPFDAWIYKIYCKDTNNWLSAYKTGIKENPEHNQKVVETARLLASEGKKVIVIFDEVGNHLKEVAKMIPEAIVLTGEDDGDKRLFEQKRFENGEADIILTTVMSEGINIPCIDAVILASGKGAKDTVHIKLSQRIGRGSRMFEGKEKLTVVDFLHFGNHFLNKHSKNRIKVMEELGGNIIYK